ncbi:MAG: Eco57I restriction-modification methylase domain-containing protein, partial [Rickettsiales bacterium]|nr:Eco57I restriction-modification methylase domain-containing protein [Rickettsiales bacterium]
DYDLSQNEKIVIVGNPPYNDTTSIIRNSIKQEQEIDSTIKTRDLGMSFLLSYSKLNADYICVLHPLSYLIKESNFKVLNEFTKNYKLIDCEIISSQEFTDKVSSTFFPIIIALYKRGEKMDYGFIKNYNFKVKNKTFKISKFDTIGNYITKYPNQKFLKESEAVAKFYTMRDINALKRSQTFMRETIRNTIFVRNDKLSYYCYVDIFKKFIPNIPYYYGNCDIMIDNEKFKKIENCFMNYSVEANREFSKYCKVENNYKEKVNEYFMELLGEHYV